MRSAFRQTLSIAALAALLFLCFVPLFMMAAMSLRKSLDIFGNFWGLPYPPHWTNYARAVALLTRPALNTLWISLSSVAGVLVFATLSGYAFARLRFAGREVLFYLILALMMVPGMLLLTPNYILAVNLGLRDTYWGLWLFYVAGGQVVGIFLLRNFLQSLPEELFEAARVEGASELQCIYHIAVPLSSPILVTVGIMTFLGLYNDLIWPLLIINAPERETLMQALLHFNPVDKRVSSRADLGIQAAGYVVASIPALIVFWFGMKSYIQGITSGAVKG
ncbi:MAG TPA: carbohydrate ABC transporter permease [Candidatus Hydrogenedentes bacterium]|nr:carbohydrate ABC transporter permease [Candidatus Hydrogenedentota bacterium]HOS01508.1 carbohydrate ABC transporter permease [Candidatus Hydrogenedentota bacterium]